MITDNIKTWYINQYPDDELGNDIRGSLSFGSFLGGMLTGGSCYVMLDVSDSVVRERVFEELSRLLGVPYVVVYDLWMMSDELKRKTKQRRVEEEEHRLQSE